MSVHEHEAWQIRESAEGGMYCAACGQGVDPDPDEENTWGGPQGDPGVPEVYPHREGVKVIWQAAGFLAVLMFIALAGAVFFTLHQKPATEVTPDQGFVSSVRAGTTKLASINDTDLISLGHKACTARRQGMTTEETLLNVASASADRTLRNDLAYTIGAAYAAYCPEYTR